MRLAVGWSGMLAIAMLFAASASGAQVMWRGALLPGKTLGDPIYRQHGLFVYRLTAEPGFVYARYAIFSLSGDVHDRGSWKRFDDMMTANPGEDDHVYIRYAWQRFSAASYSGGAAFLDAAPTTDAFEVPVDPGTEYSPPPDPWPAPAPPGCGVYCPTGPGCGPGQTTWGCIKCCYR